MFSEMKWLRSGMSLLLALALLSGGWAWADKPPWAGGGDDGTEEPEPDPPPVTYQLTWLNAFPDSYVFAMNSHGHVVGHASSPDLYGGVTFAFLYTPDFGMVDLNTLLPVGSGWLLRRGWGINDQGHIVGYGELDGDPTLRAYRYTPPVTDEDGNVLESASVEQIGPLSLDDQKWTATSINELGEICGVVSDVVANVSTAWYFNDTIGIEPVLEEMDLFAGTINDAGQIFGDVRSDDNTLLFRAVPGDTGYTPEFFHSPAGEGYLIWGNDMNDGGAFVGRTVLEAVQKNRNQVTLRTGAYRYDDLGGFFDLGVGESSEANGINSYGDVVGTVGDGSGFVYLEGEGLVNLDDAVTGTSDDLAIWFDANILPQRINDNRQIAGNSVFSFLLALVPSGN